MSEILQAERELYEGVWSSVEDYGKHSPGEQYLPLFLEITGEPDGRIVLDCGTGSGKGALALSRAGFDVRMCDVTDAGLIPEVKHLEFTRVSLWSNRLFMATSSAHFVYCTDVLEHVPPQFTMLSVHQMLKIAREGLFLTVSLVPDNFGIWAGKPLHQSVFPFTWWRDALKEVGEVVEARDMISNAAFFVRPR